MEELVKYELGRKYNPDPEKESINETIKKIFKAVVITDHNPKKNYTNYKVDFKSNSYYPKGE